MGRRKAGKGRVISVDMSDAGGSFKCRDGIYGATVEEITQEESQEGNDYLLWHITVDNGSKLLHNTSLLPQSLWNLRQTMEACGMEVPESTLDIDLDDLEGSQLGIEVENEVFQGKKRPRIVDTFPFSELDERLEESGGNVPDDEPEEPDDNQDAIEFAQNSSVVVGSHVTCDDGDVGVVTEIDGDIATVDVDGTHYEVEMDSLVLNPDEESEPESEEEFELVEGCTVTFEDDGDEYEGVVTKWSKKKCEVDVPNDDGELEIWELKPDDVTVTAAPE